MRQIVLDTETTGLEPSQGHRIIEIGCVELIDRKLTGNNYQQFINPERDVESGALEVHGLTDEFLASKPLFTNIIEDFLEYVKGAELIIHNAPFDVGFINHELKLLEKQHNKSLGILEDYCQILDSLEMARKTFPGQKNTLDALCKRFSLDKYRLDLEGSFRDEHGALLDSELLAEVYLMMTGGQGSLLLSDNDNSQSNLSGSSNALLTRKREPLAVIKATDQELELHNQRLEQIPERIWPKV